MSQKRPAIFERVGHGRFAIVTLSQEYPAGHVIPLHFHDRDQLVYASRGVMTIQTSDGSWVVPPDRAVWIPASVAHTIKTSGAVAMRTLYLKPRLAAALPRRCSVVNVSPLLRELVLFACARGNLQRMIPWQNHLIAVVLDQLKAIQTIPLQLPNPTDPRAVRVAHALLSEIGDRTSLAEICCSAGASKRTIERLFQNETGMTLGKWRQQLRLMRGMQIIAEGEKVTRAALDAGYSTPSAFIAMFKKTLGVTPSFYFRPRPETVRRRTRRSPRGHAS